MNCFYSTKFLHENESMKPHQKPLIVASDSVPLNIGLQTFRQFYNADSWLLN